MTLHAPKNASAKPQCYFSLAMSSLILHTHTSRASFPRYPIFTAFLCTEHDRITPLTKPPHHTITNTGERIQERAGVRSSKLTTDWLAMQKKSKRISFRSRHTKCPFLSWRPLQVSSSPSYLHSTSTTHLHCSQGPCILWISFFSALNSCLFTFLWSLWFVKSLEQKLSVSTWKVPEISRVLLQINKQTAVNSMCIKPTI